VISVTHIKKLKAGYEVSFDDDILFIEPEIYLKFRLKPGLDMTKEVMDQLINENDYIHYYKIGIFKLKNMQTIKEMREYLETKGARAPIIRQIISQMIDKNYLNDLVYTKTYIAFKKHQYGPQMMYHKLKEKGVSEVILKQEIAEINEQAILFDLVPKKMKSVKNKPYQAAATSIKNHFIRKGFSIDAVDRAVLESRFLFEVDELALLKKEYQKLLNAYQKKFEGYALKDKLIQKLYQKGYQMADIKKII